MQENQLDDFFDEHTVEYTPQTLEMFRNRLVKMDRHIGKWARRKRYEAYRIFDRDIPGFPYSIDRYGEELFMSEYKRSRYFDETERALRRKLAIESICLALDLQPAQIHLRQREKQKGEWQYQKQDRQQHWKEIREGEFVFLVNLTDYMDTGLFLDHRITRSMVQKEASGKHMLNLFAYTGSFSVYAAAGGAASTTTVDLSKTYVAWARKNMERNGFTGSQHKFIESDIEAFLQSAKKSHYDLIVLDPPTFSNSKSTNYTFDIQRDHISLLRQVMDLLSSKGILYFSTNFRRFKENFDSLRNVTWKEITASTIPEDFRNQRIHRAFRFAKK